MPTREFRKTLLQALVHGEHDGSGFVVLEKEHVEKTRWSDVYSMVFSEPNGKFYQVSYQEGSTEQQDESPFEYEPDEIECVEVEPHQVTLTRYLPVK